MTGEEEPVCQDYKISVQDGESANIVWIIAAIGNSHLGLSCKSDFSK